MEQTEEAERLNQQACDLANEVLKVVHQSGGTPGVQSTALAMALGATLGGYATSAMALAEVMDITIQTMGEQASAHFNQRLQSGGCPPRHPRPGCRARGEPELMDADTIGAEARVAADAIIELLRQRKLHPAASICGTTSALAALLASVSDDQAHLEKGINIAMDLVTQLATAMLTRGPRLTEPEAGAPPASST